MDLHQITIAQQQPENQFRFDADSFDQGVLRAEERRKFLKKSWAQCRAKLGRIGKNMAMASKMATRSWIA